MLDKTPIKITRFNICLYRQIVSFDCGSKLACIFLATVNLFFPKVINDEKGGTLKLFPILLKISPLRNLLICEHTLQLKQMFDIICTNQLYELEVEKGFAGQSVF